MLVSRSEQVLHALAADVRARHGVRVDILVADLTIENAATTLREQVPALGLQVELLINNAGFATAGRFELLDPAADHAQVMLNVVAVVDLTHQFLLAMAQRGNSAVINVAQIGGFHEVARAGSPAGPACAPTTTSSRSG